MDKVSTKLDEDTQESVSPQDQTKSENLTKSESEPKEKNSIELVGTVISTPVYSHDYDGQSYYSILLRVVRSYNTEKYDDLHVFVKKENLLVNGKIMDADTRLKIRGTLVQSKLHEMYDISIVANEIFEVTKNTPDKNKLILSGELIKLFDDYKIEGTKFVVKSMILQQYVNKAKKHYITVKFSAWNTTVHYINKEFEMNDHVMILGQLISKESKSKFDKSVDTVVLHEGIVSVIEHDAN